MQPATVSSLPHSPSAPATATSAWSFASWAFFGLVVLASLGIGTYWMILRASADDPLGGPVMGVIMLAGIGAAWWVALSCASLGVLCGLIGILNPDHRTNSAWTAFALNGAFVLLSAVLLLTLSP